jgi:flagellar protein FliO/FliZ
MLWTYILKLVILLPLVCGLMIGCLYLWRRLESRMPGKPATRLIAVRETMMISPGLRLAVLDFEGRRLLVSVGRGGVALIDKVGADQPGGGSTR